MKDRGARNTERTNALHGQFFKTVLKWERRAVMTVLGTVDGRNAGTAGKERDF